MQPGELLVGSFQAAVAAADPLKILARHLPPPPKGKTLVIGAGKAAASMALAVEQHWPAAAPLEGMVITRYRHGLLTNRIQVIEAGHPVPDEAGEKAARKMLRMARNLGHEDLMLVLVSGGGSALLSLPVQDVGLADLKATTRELLRCGAPIQEINTVRKHISSVLGGRLAAASRAHVLALIVSDVTGDDPTHVASGPCAPDPSTYQDAIEVLARYEVTAPKAVRDALARGASGEIPETPKPGNRIFERVENRVIAGSRASLLAAAAYLSRHEVDGVVLGDTVSGDAAEAAKVFAALTREIARHGQPFRAPAALLSGGECTVTVRGNGRGGRCSEFLLSLAIELEGLPNVHAIACDTDGIDGSEDNAGAILHPDTMERARAAGLSAKKLLAGNDAYSFFHQLSDLVVTGPTRTNVNDYRAILVL